MVSFGGRFVWMLLSLLMLGIPERAHPQGFAPGQFDSSRKQREMAARERADKAEEARDKYAQARRLTEKQRDEKAKQLAALESARSLMEQNAEKLNSAAANSVKALVTGRGRDAVTGSTKAKAKAASDGFKDFVDAQNATDGWVEGALADPAKINALRSDLLKLERDIRFYQRQEDFWSKKADEANEEWLDADTGPLPTNFFGATPSELEARRRATAARLQDNLKATRLQDNVNAARAAEARAAQSAGSKGSVGSTREPGDPSRTGAERSKRDSDRPRGEVSIPDKDHVHTEGGVQTHDFHF